MEVGADCRWGVVVLQTVEQPIQEPADEFGAALQLAVAAFINKLQLPGNFKLHFDFSLRSQRDFQVVAEDSGSSSPCTLSNVRSD